MSESGAMLPRGDEPPVAPKRPTRSKKKPSETGHDSEDITFNTAYVRSLAFVLQCAQVIVGVVVACCAGAKLCFKIRLHDQIESGKECHAYSALHVMIVYGWSGPYKPDNAFGQGFVMFVAAICIILTAFFLIVYLLNLHMSTLNMLPWRIIELIYLAAACILYLMAAGIESWYADGYSLAKNAKNDAYLDTWRAAAAFTWLNFVLYLLHFLLTLTKRTVVF